MRQEAFPVAQPEISEGGILRKGISLQKLNIAADIRRSAANGPGTRYVIWFQGCPFRCHGCFNGDFQPLIPKNQASIDEVARRVLSVNDIEGVTYTGGEPLIQAKPLYHLSAILKNHGLSIVCYTGFTLDELNHLNNQHVDKLLGLVDVLIDGRYEEDNKANLLWRGSVNQKVHLLTAKYQYCRPLLDREISEMEFVVGSQGITLTGMLQGKISEAVMRRLENWREDGRYGSLPELPNQG